MSRPEKLLYSRFVNEDLDRLKCRSRALAEERIMAVGAFLLNSDKPVSYITGDKALLDNYKAELGNKIFTWCNNTAGECYKGMWEILVNSPFKLDFSNVVVKENPFNRIACEMSIKRRGVATSVSRCAGHSKAQSILHEITGWNGEK